MKKSKILKIALFIVVLIIAVFLLLNSCHCKPFKEEWHFFSYKADMVFLNGVTLNMGFSDASHAYPFAGIEHQNIGISFTKDGKVEFTPKDGVTLHGTYTYENDGVTYTSFTITLENGEIVEGSCMKTLQETKLALTYQGIVYNFTDKGQRTGTTIYDVIERILNGDYDCLSEAEVIITDGECGVQFSEMMYYPINEGTAVYAIRIHSNGTYEVLDKVEEGKVYSTYNNKADYIVLYYVD